MSARSTLAFAVLGCLTGLAAARATGVRRERIELSAPILPPYVGIAWGIEGSSYPTTDEKRREYAALSLSFEELLPRCAPDYPAITIPTIEGAALTDVQLATNYDAVAQCAYEKFSSKPYWVPQLVDDVDVCAAKLGDDWRLLTQPDLEALDEADLTFIADTLAAVRSSEFSWGTFYFSGDVYVRANDGTLKRASLTPGVSARVTDLQPPPGREYEDWRHEHYEGGLGVRCVRRYFLQDA